MRSHSIIKNFCRKNSKYLNPKESKFSLPCRHHSYQMKNAQGPAKKIFSGSVFLGGSLIAGAAFMYWESNRWCYAAEAVTEQIPIDVEVQVDKDIIEEIPTTTPQPVVEDPDVAATPIEEPEPAFPDEVQYLLIGGGTATYSALRAIRKKDVTAKVLIVSEEAHTPYMRPPLSKELWFNNSEEDTNRLRFKQWNGKTKSLFYQKDGFYCSAQELSSKTEGGVAFAGSTKVVGLDPSENIATLADGTTIKYAKCLIATGGSPRNHPVIKAVKEMDDKTTLFRSADDFIKLNKLTDEVKSITIVGGGFMGSELACALAHKAKKNGMEVNQVFSHAGNMGQVLPEYLTKWTTGKVQEEGVNVIPDAKVENAAVEGDQVKLTLNNGKELVTDHVIVASGLEVDTSLAESAGIEVDEKLGGYKVNAELQARSNIWVAGDASCFFDPKLGRRRVEHHDHAVVSGRLAGDNMTGGQKLYTHQSMFWSDLGPEVGYEAIGIVDSSLPTVGVFAKATEDDTPKAAAERALLDEEGVAAAVESTPKKLSEDFGKGVVFYLREKDEKVVGILLWNIFGRMPLARKIIRDQQSYDDYSELAKLFKIHNEDFD